MLSATHALNCNGKISPIALCEMPPPGPSTKPVGNGTQHRKTLLHLTSGGRLRKTSAQWISGPEQPGASFSPCTHVCTSSLTKSIPNSAITARDTTGPESIPAEPRKPTVPSALTCNISSTAGSLCRLRQQQHTPSAVSPLSHAQPGQHTSHEYKCPH